MAEQQFKVLNLTGSPVNINLTAFNGKVKPIAPKGFTFLFEDELAYVRNTSVAFQRGTLKVDESTPAPSNVEIPESPNALNDEDIADLLKKPQKQIAIALEEIDNVAVVRQILESAKELDKSVKIIDIIENRLEELLT